MKNPKTNPRFVPHFSPVGIHRAKSRYYRLQRWQFFLCGCVLLNSVGAMASDTQLLASPTRSSLPASGTVIAEPCLHSRQKTIDKTLGRSVRIEAWLCGKGVQEARFRGENTGWTLAMQ